MPNGTTPAGDLQAARLERALADLRRTLAEEQNRAFQKARTGTIARMLFIAFVFAYMNLLLVPWARDYTDPSTLAGILIEGLKGKEPMIAQDFIKKPLIQWAPEVVDRTKDELFKVVPALRREAQEALLATLDEELPQYLEVVDSHFGQAWSGILENLRKDPELMEMSPKDRTGLLVEKFMDEFRDSALGHADTLYEQFESGVDRVDGILYKLRDPKASERDRIMRDIVGYTVLILREMNFENALLKDLDAGLKGEEPR